MPHSIVTNEVIDINDDFWLRQPLWVKRAIFVAMKFGNNGHVRHTLARSYRASTHTNSHLYSRDAIYIYCHQFDDESRCLCRHNTDAVNITIMPIISKNGLARHTWYKLEAATHISASEDDISMGDKRVIFHLIIHHYRKSQGGSAFDTFILSGANRF